MGLWVVTEACRERERYEELNKHFFLPLLRVQGKKEEEQCRSKRHSSVLLFFFNMKRRRFGQNAPFHLNMAPHVNFQISP
jgi:hypothetical protein